DQFLRKAPLDVAVADHRQHAVVHELAHALPHGALFLGEDVVNAVEVRCHAGKGNGQWGESRPPPAALPLGIGKREWGMVGMGNGEADSPFPMTSEWGGKGADRVLTGRPSPWESAIDLAPPAPPLG